MPSSKVRVIQIDIEPENLGRNYNLEVAIHGDAKVILERMTTLADSKNFPERTEWLSRITKLQ